MIKLDINKYLTSRTFNLDTVMYNNIKVLHMNLNQLKNVCKDFGFSTFLSESKNQTKLAILTNPFNIALFNSINLLSFLSFALYLNLNPIIHCSLCCGK